MSVSLSSQHFYLLTVSLVLARMLKFSVQSKLMQLIIEFAPLGRSLNLTIKLPGLPKFKGPGVGGRGCWRRLRSRTGDCLGRSEGSAASDG